MGARVVSAFLLLLAGLSSFGFPEKAAISGELELPGKVHHADGAIMGPLHGNPTSDRVRYSSICAGIDAVYYGNGQQLEFDIVLKMPDGWKIIQKAFHWHE
jgi:hypothetical protein